MPRGSTSQSIQGSLQERPHLERCRRGRSQSRERCAAKPRDVRILRSCEPVISPFQTVRNIRRREDGEQAGADSVSRQCAWDDLFISRMPTSVARGVTNILRDQKPANKANTNQDETPQREEASTEPRHTSANRAESNSNESQRAVHSSLAESRSRKEGLRDTARDGPFRFYTLLVLSLLHTLGLDLKRTTGSPEALGEEKLEASLTLKGECTVASTSKEQPQEISVSHEGALTGCDGLVGHARCSRLKGILHTEARKGAANLVLALYLVARQQTLKANFMQAIHGSAHSLQQTVRWLPFPPLPSRLRRPHERRKSLVQQKPLPAEDLPVEKPRVPAARSVQPMKHTAKQLEFMQRQAALRKQAMQDDNIQALACRPSSTSAHTMDAPSSKYTQPRRNATPLSQPAAKRMASQKSPCRENRKQVTVAIPGLRPDGYMRAADFSDGARIMVLREGRVLTRCSPDMASFKVNEGDILVVATPDLLNAPDAAIISTASRTMSSIILQSTEQAQWALASDLTALGALYSTPVSRKRLNRFDGKKCFKSVIKVNTFLSSIISKMPNSKNQNVNQSLTASFPQEHDGDAVVECTNNGDATCEVMIVTKSALRQFTLDCPQNKSSVPEDRYAQ